MTTPSATRDPSAFDSPDDVVGERGVLLDTVRAATVTAMAHMITGAISRERLRSLVDGDPTVRAWMLAEMHRRYPQLG